MPRALFVAAGITASLMLSVGALAQDSNGDTSSSGSSSSGLATVSFDKPVGGTPGSWVTAAISRHQSLINARVNAVRGGGQSGTLNQDTSSGGGSSSGGFSGLADLLSLAGSLGTGATGGLSSGTSGASGGGSSSGSNAGSNGGSSSGAGSLQQLLDLRDANQKRINSGDVQSAGKSVQRSQSSDARPGGSAINRLPKAADRFQQADDGEDKFVVRWANAMMQSVFSALTFGLQSRDFIDALKDGLRPVFFPTDTGTENGGGTDNGTGDTGGSDDGTGDSTGGGIDDLDPPDGSGEDGGSTI